jgi:hypothetical protein
MNAADKTTLNRLIECADTAADLLEGKDQGDEASREKHVKHLRELVEAATRVVERIQTSS